MYWIFTSRSVVITFAIVYAEHIRFAGYVEIVVNGISFLSVRVREI